MSNIGALPTEGAIQAAPAVPDPAAEPGAPLPVHPAEPGDRSIPGGSIALYGGDGADDTVRRIDIPSEVQSITDAVLGMGALSLKDVTFLEFDRTWSQIAGFDGDLSRAERVEIVSLEWESLNGVGYVSVDGNPLALIRTSGIVQSAIERGVDPYAYRDMATIQEITGAALLKFASESSFEMDVPEAEMLTELLSISTADGGIDPDRAMASALSILIAAGTNPQYAKIADALVSAVETTLTDAGVTAEDFGMPPVEGLVASEFEERFIGETLKYLRADEPVPSTRDLVLATFEDMGVEDAGAALDALVRNYATELSDRVESSGILDRLHEARSTIERPDDAFWPFR